MRGTKIEAIFAGGCAQKQMVGEREIEDAVALAFRELGTATGATETVLFTLFHAAIAG